MSFLGGAECSTAGNPLSQFSKHVQDDKTLQQDRMVGRGAASAIHGFRSARPRAPQDEMVQGFLNGSPGLPPMPLEQAHARLGEMRLDAVRARSTSPTTWADEYQGQHHFDAREFANFHLVAASSARSSPMLRTSGLAAAQPHTQQPQQRPSHLGSGLMGGGLGRNFAVMSPAPFALPQHPMHGMYAQSYQAGQQTWTGKGKGKAAVVELDEHGWEEQFAQMELQDQRQRGEEDESLVMEAELNAMDEKLTADRSETGHGDFESIWKGIQAEKAAMRGLDAEEEFAKFGHANTWAGGFDLDDFLNDWDGSHANGRLAASPDMGEYICEEQNLFQEQANPFDEGVRIMAEGGNLSLAALAFEAAVKRKPDHVEAWVLLGSAQAQNEKEEAAIRALERALKLDPNNLAALMGLAVSYTNEGYDSTAYRTLERWLSVKYPHIIGPEKLSAAADMGFTDRAQLHERVTELFLEAARLSPDGEHMDPDVQVGLGVLFYGAEDYDKAVDCFTAALRSSELGASNRRDQVHLLWNRLGATLANGGQSEEAIAAYEKALASKPNFVRARYNLGVSCINIGCHAEAAGHLLAALDMHNTVEKSGRDKARELLGGEDPNAADLDRWTQNRSNTLYDTLRRVFTQMERRDLAEKVVFGVDPDIFRTDFDF